MLKIKVIPPLAVLLPIYIFRGQLVGKKTMYTNGLDVYGLVCQAYAHV